MKIKLHFWDLDFEDAEEWREKLLEHFCTDQGISKEVCDLLQIHFAPGGGKGGEKTHRLREACCRCFIFSELVPGRSLVSFISFFHVSI